MGAPGFDDAPDCTPGVGVAKPVQFVYPYYENPDFLLRQLANWRGYSEKIRENLSAFVVDDGSPKYPARLVFEAVEDVPFPIRLFRIDVDVRWNWLAARNIAMHHARAGWCVMTDMDHMITESTAHRLINCEHDSNAIYRFRRREHTGANIHSHPNSTFLTREMFWKVGGYDEALSGFYGTDGDWRRRLVAAAPILTLPDALVRYEYVGDSSTSTYLRKQPQDAGKKAIINARKPGWKPKTLSFPYHEIYL